MSLLNKAWSTYKDTVKDQAVKMAEKRDKINLTLEVVAGNPIIPTGKVTITTGDKPYELNFKISWTTTKKATVRSISWQEKKERNAGTTIVGAVAGAVLSGGIGAVAGAAIGARTQDTSTAVMVIADEKGREFELYLRCNGKEYETLQRGVYYEESQELQAFKERLGK